MIDNQYDITKQEILKQIESAKTLDELSEVRVATMGKAGSFSAVLKSLKDVPNDKRAEVGAVVNEIRKQIENAISLKTKQFEAQILASRLESEKIDISINKPTQKLGTIHPINQTRYRIADYFVSMGFLVADSPEIETDYYNFEALNTPEDHPARDAQDTLFVSDNILLRSQTSCGQIRLMEQLKLQGKNPPIRMISPGRVYRADDVDATHSPMFHQMEGLVVDKNITLCDLKGTLDAFAKEFFGSNTTTRFRPSYFPFTEPSVEVDASCFICNGTGIDTTRDDGKTGCKVCKGTGFIEILGAGMVNKKVLANCGIDPNVYRGFAFGMGLDRITNILHAIADLRTVFENDVRFLRQFKGGIS